MVNKRILYSCIYTSSGSGMLQFGCKISHNTACMSGSIILMLIFNILLDVTADMSEDLWFNPKIHERWYMALLGAFSVFIVGGATSTKIYGATPTSTPPPSSIAYVYILKVNPSC